MMTDFITLAQNRGWYRASRVRETPTHIVHRLIHPDVSGVLAVSVYSHGSFAPTSNWVFERRGHIYAMGHDERHLEHVLMRAAETTGRW